MGVKRIQLKPKHHSPLDMSADEQRSSQDCVSRLRSLLQLPAADVE